MYRGNDVFVIVLQGLSTKEGVIIRITRGQIGEQIQKDDIKIFNDMGLIFINFNRKSG